MIIGQGANDMDFNLNFHPLDNLIKDKTSFYLEALVPFIDYKYKKYLIIYIKYKELTSLLDALEDITYVESCGFNCKAKSMDDVIKLESEYKKIPEIIKSIVIRNEREEK